MKKSYFKLTLTSLLCACGVLSIATNFSKKNDGNKAEAVSLSIEDSADHNRMYQNYYFKNLKQNYGQNYNGTCGYVAAAMLVSYYDTYWNDAFVDDRFIEKGKLSSDNIDLTIESPGYKREPYEMYMTFNRNAYIEYIKQYKDEYLHAHMLNIGLENNLVKRNSFGLFFEESYKLMNLYMKTRSELGDRDYKVKKVEVAEGNRWISYLSKGMPILLSMHSADGKKSHVAIAYDYDPDTKEIYCHMGQDSSLTHVTPESQGYAFYTEGVVIETISAHKHTSNYAYIKNGRTVRLHCACEAKFVNDIDVAALPIGNTGRYSYQVNLISGSIDPNFSYFPLTIDFIIGNSVIYTKEVTPSYEYCFRVPTEVINQVKNINNTYEKFTIRVSTTFVKNKTKSYVLCFSKQFSNDALRAVSRFPAF